MKVLPKAFELGLLYHAAKAVETGTLTSNVDGCVFVGKVKWNAALVISLVDENPVTEMLNPLRVIAQGIIFVITGTVGLTVITTGAGTGSAMPWEFAKLVVVIVMVPATVPIIRGTLAEAADGVMAKLAV